MIPKSLCRSFSLVLVSNVYFEQSLLFNEVRLLHESEKKSAKMVASAPRGTLGVRPLAVYFQCSPPSDAAFY